MNSAASTAMPETLTEISTTRFHLLAGYNLSPGITVTEEGPCYELANECAIGMIYKDPGTNLFGCVGLIRDADGLYQKAHESIGVVDFDAVSANLNAALELLVSSGAPVGKPNVIDLLSPVVPPEKQNTSFKSVLTEPRWQPLRTVIPHLMRLFEDIDNNFVEQFQTTAFDARIWELYLFLALTEEGQTLDRTKNRPDFIGTTHGGFLIEAVTVQPTIKNGTNMEVGLPTDPVALGNYMRQYIPIKYGSPLFSKTRYYHDKLNIPRKMGSCSMRKRAGVPCKKAGLSVGIDSRTLALNFS